MLKRYQKIKNGLMNMSNTKKVILYTTTLATIISIILIIINPEEFPIWITSIISIFGLISAYFQFIYENWDQFYLYINKKIAMFKGDTVAWEATYKFYTNNSTEDFSKYGIKFNKSIKSKLNGAKVKNYVELETKISFDINYKGYDRKIELFFDPTSLDNDIISIRLKYICSVSYKDSKKEFENFEEIVDILKNDFILYMSNDNLLPLYTVKINFSKLNPFYKLAIKHVDAPRDVSFKLSFKENNSSIRISNNEIEVITKKKEELNEILNNYTALVSVGN